MALQCKGTCNTPNYALWDLVGSQAYRDRPIIRAEPGVDAQKFMDKERAITILKIEGEYCYQTGIGTELIKIEECFWDRCWQPAQKDSVKPSKDGEPIQDCPCTCDQGSLSLEEVVDKVAFRDRPAVISPSTHQPAADFQYSGEEGTVLITKWGNRFYVNDLELPLRFQDYCWKIFPKDPIRSQASHVVTIKELTPETVVKLMGDDQKHPATDLEERGQVNQELSEPAKEDWWIRLKNWCCHYCCG